jgi:putative SOS response-associated peptidase YedK
MNSLIRDHLHMCFSVNVNLIKEELENRYGATFLDPDKYHPSYYYHAFSLPDLPAICSGQTDKIRMLKWGLIPSWVKSKENADEIRFKTFNARAETVDSKPSYSASFSTKRCIIPVRGFFEWQHTSSGKVPWYIFRADEDIISLAGLWSNWVDDKTGEVVDTFSIITTEANAMMAEIHNSGKRMPAILERDMEKDWISIATSTSEALMMLNPGPSEILKAYTVSPLINNRTIDRNTPEVIQPFQWDQKNLFS